MIAPLKIFIKLIDRSGFLNLHHGIHFFIFAAIKCILFDQSKIYDESKNKITIPLTLHFKSAFLVIFNPNIKPDVNRTKFKHIQFRYLNPSL